MSLDKLAIIFIIIVLPISVVLSSYTDLQTKTLNLQISYDSKLNKSTADAVKAYQLNAFYEGTSDLSVSKMRNIEAAANTFFNSMASNFNMTGYGIETLQEYVPALVFTMYDGYYIYSKYTNTLQEEDYQEGDAGNGIEASTYQNGELIYGLKPFISYSCRYIRGTTDDFVISYSLDNYISIQGKVKGEWRHLAGYLIDYRNITINSSSSLTYRGKTISRENILKERIGNKDYKYHKIKGIKYYYDDETNKWFSLLNGEREYTSLSTDSDFLNYDYSAYKYYKEAKEFTESLMSLGLDTLTYGDAYEIRYQNGGNQRVQIASDLGHASTNTKIFGNTFAEAIEEPDSNFNEHRLAVIKYTIEKNLSIAIRNYNKYGEGKYSNFQMPKLEESEWDKIMNNTTLISFIQGMPIGTKIYNGCCVIANNKNEEVIAEESIYLGNNATVNGDKYYYNALYKDFTGSESLLGILNTDLERRSLETDIEPIYYYPKQYLASYDSVVSANNNVNIYAEETTADGYNYAYNGNIYKYMQNNAKPKVASAYFTALGRERYGTYKINAPEE